MKSLLDMTPEQLRGWFADRNLPSYRADQVLRWLFSGRAARWDQMTDIHRHLRAQLAGELPIWSTTVVRRLRADDGTEKLLLRLTDHQTIECVLIRDRQRRTFCISTQAGCAMGCVFCASGIGGLKRNLSTGEIVEQMLRLRQLLPPSEPPTHVVVMGMGEPLANLANLLPALELARSREGLGMSPRGITISTVGLPAAIRRLAKATPHYRLAISLHAPNDEIRDRIVPTNGRIGTDEILEAADEYFQASGRRLTFEYVLLAGINDLKQHAQQLARRLVGRAVLVNLIPYNPVAGLPYRTPDRARQLAFRDELARQGVPVQFRKRKGDQIAAACGQLRQSADVVSDINECSSAVAESS
jgi:23S rRNA (adenine2503-C2)-methyltransferase